MLENFIRNEVQGHHLIEHQKSSTDFQYRPNRTNIDGVMAVLVPLERPEGLV